METIRSTGSLRMTILVWGLLIRPKIPNPQCVARKSRRASSSSRMKAKCEKESTKACVEPVGRRSRMNCRRDVPPVLGMCVKAIIACGERHARSGEVNDSSAWRLPRHIQGRDLRRRGTTGRGHSGIHGTSMCAVGSHRHTHEKTHIVSTHHHASPGWPTAPSQGQQGRPPERLPTRTLSDFRKVYRVSSGKKTRRRCDQWRNSLDTSSRRCASVCEDPIRQISHTGKSASSGPIPCRGGRSARRVPRGLNPVSHREFCGQTAPGLGDSPPVARERIQKKSRCRDNCFL